MDIWNVWIYGIYGYMLFASFPGKSNSKFDFSTFPAVFCKFPGEIEFKIGFLPLTEDQQSTISSNQQSNAVLLLCSACMVSWDIPPGISKDMPGYPGIPWDIPGYAGVRHSDWNGKGSLEGNIGIKKK